MDPGTLLDALSSAETSALVAELERRGLAIRVSAAGALDQVPLETLERAATAKVELAVHYGVNAEAVEIVAVKTDDGPRAVVVLSTTNALKRGSWDDLEAERAAGAFDLDIGEQVVDSYGGMTWPVYQALVAQLAEQGLHLPDSQGVTEQSDEPWTCTLLTGEPMDGDRVPFAFVNNGEPGRSWGGRDYTGGLRFRPAAVIG